MDDNHSRHSLAVVERVCAAQRRLWVQSLVRWAAVGAAFGAVAGVLVAVIAAMSSLPHARSLAIVALGAGVVVGCVVGLMRRPSLKAAALAIDNAADFKDRVHSALQFSGTPAHDGYRELQIADAAAALDHHPLHRLFPWRWPREGTWATMTAALLIVTVLLVPKPQKAAASFAGPAPAVVVEIAQLEEQLHELEQAADELHNKELKELAQKLHKALDKMLTESRTSDDAMLHLARMTAVVDSAAASFDPLLLEQALKSLGEGIKGVEPLGPIAQMLQQGQYADAAKALTSLGQAIESGAQAMPKAGSLTQVKLGELAQQTGASSLGEMSQSLGQISGAIQSGSKSECKNGCCNLGGNVSQSANRIQASNLLRSQLSKLNEHKESLCKNGGYCSACRSGNGQCKGGQCKNAGLCSGCKSGGQCQGGNCTGIKIGLPSLSFARSNSPSRSAGSAVSGVLFDKATQMRAGRKREQITGQLGEGDSDTETEHSPDAQQTAATRYRQVYAKYSKISDSVMDEEAVPLAHRQMIKKYFELIHPDRVEAEGLLKDAPSVATDNIAIKK